MSGIEFFTAPDGARLAYRDEVIGAGGPVVLGLAGLTREHRDFDFVRPHLPDCRFVRMDYRGRGASEWTGEKSYTVPREASDAVALLDHLGIDRAGVLGTSRGGLVGMYLAHSAHDRLWGLCLNDIGPVLEREGLEPIFAYLGRNPSAPTHAALAAQFAQVMTRFTDVPDGRWLAEARRLYAQRPDGLEITYDPELRPAFMKLFERPGAESCWPLFDACDGLALAVIRGANSDLLSRETVAEMRRRRPDMIAVEVPGRGHIPWLDEPEAVAAVRAWVEAAQPGAR